MKNIIKYLFIVIVIIFSGCNFNNNKGFYEYYGGFDYIRIPLIQPFELIKTTGEDVWFLQPSLELYTFNNVFSINVEDSIIFFYCKEYKLKSEKWYIIDLKNKSTVSSFNNNLSFYNKLDSIGIKDIKLHNADSLFIVFKDKKQVPWIK